MSPDNRRYNSLRLHGYDYSESGAYFITATVYQRQNLFADLINGEVKTNQFGQIAEQIWTGLSGRFPQIRLDVYCIMPDHMHGIVIIDSPAKPELKMVALSDVLRVFKSLSAFQINKVRGTPG